MKKSAIDHAIDMIAERDNISVAEAGKLFVKQSDFAIKIDDITPQTHNWTDRGLKLTCENAGHPYHEAWKPRRAL